MKVGINGLGRIGRLFLRQARARGVEVAGINDLAPCEQLAYLMRYDSAQGRYPGEVRQEEGALVVDGARIPVTGEREPARLPWAALGVDVVAECTGVWRERETVAAHLAAGARRVVVSAPIKDADLTLVMGVNEVAFDPARHFVLSNASCTTNCLAPVARVLLEEFGLVRGMLTTVHAYTSSQALVDGPARKFRRGRAAAVSMVPTSTGAARATALVIPELQGKLDGIAVRVPVIAGSLVDLVATTEREVSVETVNAAFRRAAESPRLKGILGVAEDEWVSADVVGDPRSAVVDLTSTMTLGRDLVKVFAWYDNEWGYSARLLDAVLLAGRGA